MRWFGFIYFSADFALGVADVCLEAIYARDVAKLVVSVCVADWLLDFSACLGFAGRVGCDSQSFAFGFI